MTTPSAISPAASLQKIVWTLLGIWALEGCQSAPSAKKSATPLAIQVEVTRPSRGDVPIWRTGIGTATGLFTASVRSQVDGPLVSVDFVEGQRVLPGQVLAHVDPRPYQIAQAQARATLLRDRSQRDNGKLNLERSQGLLPDHLVSAQAVSDLAASLAQLDALVLADEAALKAADLQLERATIRAPIAGRVGFRQTDPGNLVRAGDANSIVTITQLDPAAVVFTLPEDDVFAVTKALEAGDVEVDILGRHDDNVLAKGKLLLMDTQINVSSGTVRLKALVDNKDERLWPNQFVRARVLLGQHVQARRIPAQAVSRGARGDHVWIVDGKQNAVAKKVIVTAIVGTTALIESGIEDDDQVIVEGQFRLQPGSKVEIVSSEAAEGAQDTSAEGQPEP